MYNIFNRDLIEMIMDKMPEIEVIETDSKLIVSHHEKEWDFICILAQRLGFVAERWMQNQKPFTTIYNKI